MNDTIRAALVNVIKATRMKMSRAQRSKGVKPQRWLYPYATETRYAATIRTWLRPMQSDVQDYLKENQEAILRGDSADTVSVTRIDAVPGKSFKLMIESLNGWLGQYVPEDNEAVSGSPIYMGLGRIADSVFDFNEGQFEKSAKSILGVEFPVGEEWWPDARDTWANNNYQLIRSDMRDYIGQINSLTEQAVTTGQSVKTLRQQIMKLNEKISKSRANFLARDQIGKLNGQITQRRMEDAGLEMYIWETAGDERVRSSHIPMDGALCRWDDSTVFSQDGGKTWINRPSNAVLLHPGMDFQCRCSAIAYWQELVGEADAIIAQYEELDNLSALNIAATAAAPKPEPPAPPPPPAPEPKKFVTQKMLQSEISELNKQIKALEGKSGTADQKLLQELKAKKEALETEIENRKLRADRKKLTKELKALEKELEGFEIKTYSGIWIDDVTVKDYEAKAASIEQKKAYYESKLKTTGLSALDKAKFKAFLQDIKDFEVEGKKYIGIIASIGSKRNQLTALKRGSIIDNSDPYSKARKDAALWAKSAKEADKALRGGLGELWNGATKDERRAAYDYTSGSGGFNRPLRGYDNNWQTFKGAGKVPLNNEGRGTAIKNLTDLINRSTYDFDIWLQRGIETSRGAAAFLGISENELRHWSQEQLNKNLLDVRVKDNAFLSCGSTKGHGFSGGYVFNIYCPKGTKMLYAEPFSAFGHGARSSSWDGKSGQTSFSSEDETIIQRGTSFRVTRIEKKGAVIFFDIEVVGQI